MFYSLSEGWSALESRRYFPLRFNMHENIYIYTRVYNKGVRVSNGGKLCSLTFCALGAKHHRSLDT